MLFGVIVLLNIFIQFQNLESKPNLNVNIKSEFFPSNQKQNMDYFSLI